MGQIVLVVPMNIRYKTKILIFCLWLVILIAPTPESNPRALFQPSVEFFYYIIGIPIVAIAFVNFIF